MSDAFKIVGIVCVVLIFVGLSVAYQYGTIANTTFVVNDKDRVSYGSGDDLRHKYLIYTNTETFENTDALFHGKFNSSDIYGKIKIGKKYDAVVYGWRLPFFSAYRNIINIRENKKG